MEQLTKKQLTAHLDAVTEALPNKLREKARNVFGKLKIKGGATVKIEREWSGKPYFMKVDFSWEFKERVKCFRILKKTKKFSYDKVAAHITKVFGQHTARLARREKGESLAQERIEALKTTFESNPMLNALNLEIDSTPVHQTEDGEVDVGFYPQDHDSDDDSDCWVRTTATYDGKAFAGDIEFDRISPEQLVALQVILRADKLSIIDMLHLADDSVLGPIIHKMTEDAEGRKKGDNVRG